MKFVAKQLVLQGNIIADGWTIEGLDLSGLNLTKNSVGLGNVDNTSDLNKPVSTATNVALGLKQDVITLGTTDQYFKGDLSLGTLGALGSQGGDTTLQSLSAIGLNATTGASVSARRNDYTSGPSFAATVIEHFGASYAGSLLGLSGANAGVLKFVNATNAFLFSNGLCPLIFGYNGIRRMRLMTGLHVGGDTDPGAGCIEASGDITAGGSFEGVDMTLSGGATLGDDLILSGGGANLDVGGNAVIAGGLTVDLTVGVGQNLGVGGNLAVTGATVNFLNLPTSNPGVAGQLWRSTNTVMISTG